MRFCSQISSSGTYALLWLLHSQRAPVNDIKVTGNVLPVLLQAHFQKSDLLLSGVDQEKGAI